MFPCLNTKTNIAYLFPRSGTRVLDDPSKGYLSYNLQIIRVLSSLVRYTKQKGIDSHIITIRYNQNKNHLKASSYNSSNIPS